MSETLTPSRSHNHTASARAEHDAARDTVLQGTINQLRGLEKEQNITIPAAAFQERYDQLVQARHEDGEVVASDVAYADVMLRNQNNDNLSGADQVAFVAMHHDLELHATETAIDPAVLGDNKEATVRELLADAEALPDDDPNKEGSVRALTNVLANIQLGVARSTGTELSDYVEKARTADAASDDNRTAAENDLDAARANFAPVFRNTQDEIVALQLIAAKYPAPSRVDAAPQDQAADQQAAPAEKSQELIDAEQQLATIRDELAALSARREKRMWGADSGRGEASSSQKVKELKESYRIASRGVFELQHPGLRDDQSIAQVDKIKMVADYTIAEAGKLDQTILESYKNNNTKFGKLLDWYGKRGVTTKVLVGGLGGMLIGAVTGGVGTAAWSGTLMAASFEARSRAKRAEGENMLQLDGTGGLLDMLDKRLDGANGTQTLATIDVDAALDLMQGDVAKRVETRIEKSQNKRAVRVLGSYAAGAAIGVVTHNLPGGLFDGLHGPHDQVANVVGDHGVASGVDPSHAAQLPAPDALHNIYTGPANVYVNPGDGFYKVFEQMHIPQDQWNTVLDKIGSNLVQHGDAYVMPDGGIGISAPGQMSQAAVDLIKNAANFR